MKYKSPKHCNIPMLIKQWKASGGRGYIKWLKKLGFKKIGQGCSCRVFSHKVANFVIKIGGCLWNPRSRSRHFLKYTHIIENQFAIQPKCDTVYSYKREGKRRWWWEEECSRLASKVSGFYDSHVRNLGIIHGETVILDW